MYLVVPSCICCVRYSTVLLPVCPNSSCSVALPLLQAPPATGRGLCYRRRMGTRPSNPCSNPAAAGSVCSRQPNSGAAAGEYAVTWRTSDPRHTSPAPLAQQVLTLDVTFPMDGTVRLWAYQFSWVAACTLFGTQLPVLRHLTAVRCSCSAAKELTSNVPARHLADCMRTNCTQLYHLMPTAWSEGVASALC